MRLMEQDLRIASVNLGRSYEGNRATLFPCDDASTFCSSDATFTDAGVSPENATFPSIGVCAEMTIIAYIGVSARVLAKQVLPVLRSFR